MVAVGEQIAALPIQWDVKGRLKVLMVTSRGTKRWVMPKGWEMDNTKPWDAAAIEAMEEAGARGTISSEVLGTYRYLKVKDNGKLVPCLVRVYPMLVEELKRDWKERGQRTRKWFSPKTASKLVVEQELSELLLSLHKKPHKQPIIRNLMKAS